jgi:hypothetical protein
MDLTGKIEATIEDMILDALEGSNQFKILVMDCSTSEEVVDQEITLNDIDDGINFIIPLLSNRDLSINIL